ncbi:uncharacterized protein PRCAT00002610001 [Priceomyces carsonii]|uniref:uncharacterized protein n=1 Tax=Priceomyces carsonii TaxID=28549 RepID=UPI002EDA9DA6|nr:unnamed protein product [Priceomyces carsonii]
MIRQVSRSHFIRGYSSLSTHTVPNSSLEQMSAIQSTIRKDIFSRREKRNVVNYLKLSYDSYPNPLFNMEKDEILKLSIPEYLHLAKVPYKSLTETNNFCTQVAEIIHDLIIVDIKRVVKMIEGLKDEKLKDIVLLIVRQNMISDRIKRSIFEFIISPSSPEFTLGFFKNLKYIIGQVDKNTVERCELLLNYLNTLALINHINKKPILLSTELFDKVRRLIPGEKRGELYLYFLNLNIQTKDLKQLEKIKRKLMKGSNLEKFVARTGWIAPKWHDVNRSSLGIRHEKKMENFFSIKDLEIFANFAIQRTDIVNANLYLRLLVQKFESKCMGQLSNHNPLRMGDTTTDEDTQIVLNLILQHIMTFRGPDHSVKVLKYMIKNDLEISFKTLFILVRNLRTQGYHQECLKIINSINLTSLTEEQRLRLVEEIVLLIKEKFPDSPKILIGYIVSCFNGSGSHESAFDILNDINLLGICYGNGKIGTINSIESVLKANIDSRLTGFNLTHSALANIYEVVLNTIPRAQVTPEFISMLYDHYIGMIAKKRDYTNLFDKEHLDDSVVTILVKYLLKVNVNSADMELTYSKTNFEIAKKIVTDFNKRAKLKRKNRSVFLQELLVYSSLLYHNDYQFALLEVRFSRSKGLPFSFNQVYPFIQYHFYNKQYDQAKLWYDQLVKHGVKTTAFPAKNLYRIARQLQWPISGFTYRKLLIHRNHKKRDELRKLANDPINMIDHSELENEITEELIHGSRSEEKRNSNFSEELASVVYQANFSTPSRGES